MKVECIKEKLAEAVTLAEKITAKNATLPVLKCVLLEGKDNKLLIKATNLDLGIEISLSVKVAEPGKVAVPGSTLNAFITGLSGEKTVHLETKEGNLSVSTSKNKTLIKAYPPEDFPSIPEVKDGKKLTFNSRDLIAGFKSVWYSASISSMKPELSSVFIYPDNDAVVFVATDSFRLAEKKIKTKQRKEFSQILIPFKNIPEIIRVLEQAKGGDVDIILSKNQISLEIGEIRLVSRVIDGVFPDYKQILPKESHTEVVVLKQDLLNSLKMANIFSDTFNQISLKITPSKKVFELHTKNGEVGENLEKLEAALSGNDIEISFNYKYINDGFQSINADSVSLSFNGPGKPLVMRGVNDRSFLYLVSPMNK
jgi:DNA polymerase-3 subunit beta